MLWTQIILYCFCLSAFIQTFYYLFFFLRLALHKSLPASIQQTQPVSVIVCAKNEAANLTKNLPEILMQEYAGEYEVIVVNDNSTDDSKQILHQYQQHFSHLKVIDLKEAANRKPGKKFPLSIGVKNSKYETILLTDADCKPAEKHWIKKMQQGFTENIEIVLGYSGYKKQKGFLNKLIRWETFSTALQYFSYAKAGIAYMGVGRNLSYKKSLFFRNGGFSSHEHTASGDDDLFINKAATKKNTSIIIYHDAFTFSEAAQTWKEWINQKRRHYSTGRYYKRLHKFLLGLYSLSHFLFYPLFIISLFFYWKISLLLFLLRLFVQAFVFYKTMKKLNEDDLFKWFLVLDVWMFFYYLIFSFSLYSKPVRKWK